MVILISSCAIARTEIEQKDKRKEIRRVLFNSLGILSPTWVILFIIIDITLSLSNCFVKLKLKRGIPVF